MAVSKLGNAQGFNKNRITDKYMSVYQYITQYYLEPQNEHDVMNNGILAMAQYIDSTKAKKIVKKVTADNTFETYRNFLTYVIEKESDTLDLEEMTEYGVVGMLKPLDPHSVYIPKEEFEAMNAPLKGSFDGVGIRFQILEDTLMVVQTIPGGPSEKVGVMAGDQIVTIDGENIAGVGLKNTGVRDRLLGEKGTEVKVQIKRAAERELLDFTIIRDKIPTNSLDVAYMVTDSIGYIKLNNFAANTMEEFRTALTELKEKGMKDLILDLQGNGGGYLSTAVSLADEFLTTDKLEVYVQGQAFPRRDFNSTLNGDFEKGRLVILADESTASASEIVSGAIQDWDRGLIIGRRTFGKGLVQRQVELPDTSAIRLTIQRYYTPTGRHIQKPYTEGREAYALEKYNRYSNGEVYSLDSLDLPDSLMFETFINKRKVYGGGGILPDIFVPYDTSGTSKYFSQLIRKGILNNFTLDYVQKNRTKLSKKYPDFDRFNADFNSDKLMDDLIAYAEKKGLEFNEEEFKESEEIIALRLKASMATNLFDLSKFYIVINEINDPLRTAVEVLENGKYDSYHLK